MSPVEFEIRGLKLVSEANQREHHMVRARRKKLQTDTARAHALSHRARPVLPLRIVITRIGAKRLDQDNLAGACKGVQDGLALAYKFDDGDPRVQWVYEQECRRSQNGVQPYGVRVKVEAA